MNNWNDELMAEYRRRELIREADQIRREKLGVASRVDRPSLFTRTMYNFGNWMIARGKQIRNRYEIPSAACGKSPTGSFAR